VAVDGWDGGASGGVISDRRVIGQKEAAIGQEGIGVIFDDIVVSASTEDIAASTEPTEMTGDGRVEVGQRFQLAVGAGGIEEVVITDEIWSQWVGLKDHVVFAFGNGRSIVGSPVGVEDNVSQESLAVKGLLLTQLIIARIESLGIALAVDGHCQHADSLVILAADLVPPVADGTIGPGDLREV
jgi:hypothetical protein